MKKVSDKGIKLLKGWEGEVLHGYKDAVGFLTVGVGHLVKKGEPYKLNQKVAQAESTRLLREDLKRFEDCINASVKVPITQNQFDALVSFSFNVGESALKRSSVLKNLNGRKFASAADAFLLWNKAGGKILPGLHRRRKEERELFLTPDASQSSFSTAKSELASSRSTSITAGETLTNESDARSEELSPPPPDNSNAVSVPQIKPEPQEEKQDWGIKASFAAAATFITAFGGGVIAVLKEAQSELIYGFFGAAAIVGIVFVIARFIYISGKEKRESNEKMQREQRAHDIQLVLLNSAARKDLNAVMVTPQPMKNSDSENKSAMFADARSGKLGLMQRLTGNL